MSLYTTFRFTPSKVMLFREATLESVKCSWPCKNTGSLIYSQSFFKVAPRDLLIVRAKSDRIENYILLIVIGLSE